MLIDLETSEQSLLIPDLSTPFGIEWVDQENIVYINRVNGRSQLVNYSLKEGTSTVIFSSSNVSLKGFSMFNNSRKAVLEAQRSDFNIDKVILGDTTPLSKTALINFTSSDLSPTLNTRGQMAFISDYSGIEQIWLLDKGESTPTQVTYFKESSTISNPEWSPDGNEIIFSTKRTNRGLRIEKIRANGTSHKILVEGKANYDNPSWSMDNKFIYFYSDSLKVPQLFKMDLDTKNRQQITFSEGLFGRETLRGFFFVKFGEPGIWKLTEDGDEELIIEDMSYFSLSDWQVNGDTLIYLRTRNNDPALIFYDMKQKANIRKIALPDLKMPVPSLGLALNLAENELYITSSKELTSALNTLEW
jgi:Tol biopolymer transport system component